MLKELRIEDFAIIRDIELKFKPGLSTFTGETGAGKSILLDAIEALVGGRVEDAMIRSGAKRANLEAVFEIPQVNREAIVNLLEEEDLLEDSQAVVLSREIRRRGRNIARVNGRSVNINLARNLGTYLVDIHGQSEHLSLRKVHEHLGLLDRYADTEEFIRDYRKTYGEMRSIQSELHSLHEAEEDAARQTDLLNYQIQEIEAANLEPGEEDGLHQELTRLANAEKLTSLAQKSYTLLDEANADMPSINAMLGEVVQAINSLAAIDTSLKELAEQCASISAVAGDASLELRDYINQLEYNPRRLEQTENRLALISNLKRKYGDSEEAILTFAKKAKQQLEKITHAEERIAELEIQEQEVMQTLTKQVLMLSEARKQAATSLSKSVENELNDLNMTEARFSVDIQNVSTENGVPINDSERVKFDETGIDQVEFLIEPNPGEGLKPLVKIASGGETSRLMLALKNVLARADTIPTLIFDEIDQGIGGKVGALVGEKLWQLGRQHQVFCVTHLPQLAAFGNQHYGVHKEIREGRTITLVNTLDGEVRINELANMYGGISEANREAAIEALWSAKQKTVELQQKSSQ
ncbi:MAG TPA: DNA repair protein RecN [Anaerolineae bacterium]|nr:DNA repair protein RecN [Anaerolineae bacterium]